MKTVIHINQHVIQANRKSGERKPPITAKNYRENNYGHEVVVNGPCRIVYTPDKPLSCGAVCYVTTEAEVEIINRDAVESLPCPNQSFAGE